MSNHRVLKYEATVYYASSGSSHTMQYAFTQAQANEVGAVLEADVIPLQTAIKLCETTRPNAGGNSAGTALSCQSGGAKRNES